MTAGRGQNSEIVEPLFVLHTRLLIDFLAAHSLVTQFDDVPKYYSQRSRRSQFPVKPPISPSLNP